MRSASDWRCLFVAALMQLVVGIALRVMPLRVLQAAVARLRRFVQIAVRPPEARTIWAIEATGRRLGRISTCLVRALVAQLLLGSTERPVGLTIGVRLTPERRLDAHAWAEREGRVLIGAGPDRYEPFCTFY